MHCAWNTQWKGDMDYETLDSVCDIISCDVHADLYAGGYCVSKIDDLSG